MTSEMTNRRAWDNGLDAFPDAEQARNVILPDDPVGHLAEAHEHSPAFGLFVEVAAVTGARVSQFARLEAQDLQCLGAAPDDASLAQGQGEKRSATPARAHFLGARG